LRKFFTALFTALAFPTFVLAQSAEVKQMNAQMLRPTVVITTDRSSGSGTVLFSGDHNGKHRTIILTNYHVIEDSYTTEKEWDDDKGTWKNVRKQVPPKVKIYEYADTSRFRGVRERDAKIIASSSGRDLAVVEVHDPELTMETAKIAPEGSRVDMGETVWASGGGLGLPPFLSPPGILGYNHQTIQNYTYTLATASIAPGNSGGGLYRKNHETGEYELIGVPSRGARSYAHIGFAIPINEVRDFLRSNTLGFIPGVKKELAPRQVDSAKTDEK
jgi:S1-C subfamily serine protease